MVTLKEITDNIGAVLAEMLNSSDITSSTTVTNFVTSLQSFITELSNYFAQQISSISGACSTNRLGSIYHALLNTKISISIILDTYIIKMIY